MLMPVAIIIVLISLFYLISVLIRNKVKIFSIIMSILLFLLSIFAIQIGNIRFEDKCSVKNQAMPRVELEEVSEEDIAKVTYNVHPELKRLMAQVDKHNSEFKTKEEKARYMVSLFFEGYLNEEITYHDVHCEGYSEPQSFDIYIKGSKNPVKRFYLINQMDRLWEYNSKYYKQEPLETPEENKEYINKALKEFLSTREVVLFNEKGPSDEKTADRYPIINSKIEVNEKVTSPERGKYYIDVKISNPNMKRDQVKVSITFSISKEGNVELKHVFSNYAYTASVERKSPIDIDLSHFDITYVKEVK